MAQVAAADWRAFLDHRAQELIPGGQLVLVIGAIDDGGTTGLEPLMELANKVLGRLVSGGKLAAEVHAAMTISARPRTRQEFLAPFAEGDVAPLVVEEFAIAETPNPALLRWQETRDAAPLPPT